MLWFGLIGYGISKRHLLGFPLILSVLWFMVTEHWLMVFAIILDIRSPYIHWQMVPL